MVLLKKMYIMLATNSTLNAKINEVKDEISSVTSLATTTTNSKIN